MKKQFAPEDGLKAMVWAWKPGALQDSGVLSVFAGTVEMGNEVVSLY